MAFRARTIGFDGGFGAPATIAGFELTGAFKPFMTDEVDDELGFDLPPAELLEAEGVQVETLEGPPWPGSQADRAGQGEGKLAMARSFQAGTWPTEAELALQANVRAKLDPKTRDGVLMQHYRRSGFTDEAARREIEKGKRPAGPQLLDGVKPITPKLRERGRALPVAGGDGADVEVSANLTPAQAQEAREAKAAGKAARKKKAG